MKFLVTRTSFRADSERPPIKGTVFERFTRVDIRTSHSFEEFDRKVPGSAPFTGKGENHRILRGPRGGATGIARDFPGEASGWFIEINTLEELISMNDNEGDIILTWCYENSDIREIEIYDGYRE